MAVAAISGCGSSGGGSGVSSDLPAGPAKTMIMAIDTSGSARSHHETMFNRAIQTIARLPRETRLVMYRFDASPAEVYDGEPMADEAEAGIKLKKELAWTSKTLGTDLASLVRQIDSRLAQLPKPIALDFYTDCGSELMTKEDDAFVRRTVANWHEVDVKFIGVESGHRERLRSMFGSKEIRVE